MAFQALLTDLNGLVRKYVKDYESIVVTRRLGDFSECSVVLDVRDSAASEVAVAERALKIYDGDTLMFFGQVWEPLEFNESTVQVKARDPFAGFNWRRVRESTTYTGVDSGAII